MIDGRKVIAFTPAGRQRYMEILLRFMERDHKRGLIDEWVLFNNAYVRSDEQYTQGLGCDWVRVLEEPGHRDAFHIHSFYKHFSDPEAVYLRFDDDICYVSPNAVQRLVEHRLGRSDSFLVYPMIVNNTRVGYWMQRHGILPPEEFGSVQNNILDSNAYTSPEYAKKLHRKAIDSIRAGREEEEFNMPCVTLSSKQDPAISSPASHLSINCFAMVGADMIGMKDSIGSDEERYQSLYRPAELGRPNCTAPGAVVVHFAYHTQTKFMEESGMLEDYKQISMSL